MSDQRRGKGQPQPKEQAKTKSKAGGVEAMTDAELDAILATAFVGLEVAQAGGSGGGAKKGDKAGGGSVAAALNKQDQSPTEAPPGLAAARRKATGPLMLMDAAKQCNACWGWPPKPRQCGRCELVSYCDKRCQEWDWRKHKPNCLTMEEQAAKKAINEELMLASFRGQLRSVRQLLAERGANVNYFDDEGFFPLFVASQEGHVQVVDALLEAGAQVNATRPKDSATALHSACHEGKVAVVQSLVRAGANVNQTTSDEYADSPLIIAAQNGHVQIIDALVAAGARLDYARPKGGSTALIKACENGFVGIVQSLVRAGTNVNQTTSHEFANSPLIMAAQLGHVQVVDVLIAAGARLDYARPKGGCTALIIACQFGKVAVVQSLVRAGANVNQTMTDEYADSPLIMAAQFGHVQVVDVLVAAGARLDYARPKGGCTALYTACQFGLIDVVRSLLSAGADPRLALHNGFTPLAVAMHNDHPAVADLVEARLAELVATPADSA